MNKYAYEGLHVIWKNV